MNSVTAAVRTSSGGRLRRLVAALSVTQTVGYGVLTYAFSALVGPMCRELGISTTTAVGASTTAVLVSGLMSIPVGRWLDVRGGRGLMTAGSVLAALAVLGWSQVQTAVQLYGVFVAIGIASAMVLYPPAFAVVVALANPASRTNALLVITVFGGFASTIFIPLTGQLTDAYGWRHAILILSSVLAATTIPLHAIAVRRTRPRAAGHERTGSPGRVLRDPGFWLLAGAFVVHSAALAVIAIHLVLYLISLGHPPARAAALAGLLGLLSVTGRLVTSLSVRWLPMATITAAILFVQGVAISLMPLVGRHVVGAIGCLVLFGLGFGVSSIATPAILIERYGATGYGTISGILTTPVTIARAVGPLGGAVLVEAFGYRPLILTVAAACAAAAGALALTQRLTPGRRTTM
jgi:predicted MFS family arabinose efflux permease